MACSDSSSSKENISLLLKLIRKDKYIDCLRRHIKKLEKTQHTNSTVKSYIYEYYSHPPFAVSIDSDDLAIDTPITESTSCEVLQKLLQLKIEYLEDLRDFAFSVSNRGLNMIGSPDKQFKRHITEIIELYHQYRQQQPKSKFDFFLKPSTIQSRDTLLQYNKHIEEEIEGMQMHLDMVFVKLEHLAQLKQCYIRRLSIYLEIFRQRNHSRSIFLINQKTTKSNGCYLVPLPESIHCM